MALKITIGTFRTNQIRSTSLIYVLLMINDRLLCRSRRGGCDPLHLRHVPRWRSDDPVWAVPGVATLRLRQGRHRRGEVPLWALCAARRRLRDTPWVYTRVRDRGTETLHDAAARRPATQTRYGDLMLSTSRLDYFLRKYLDLHNIQN